MKGKMRVSSFRSTKLLTKKVSLIGAKLLQNIEYRYSISISIVHIELELEALGLSVRAADLNNSYTTKWKCALSCALY
jgi:hypothetical protein